MKYNEDRGRAIVELRQQGCSYTKIMEKTGAGKGAVAGALRRAGMAKGRIGAKMAESEPLISRKCMKCRMLIRTPRNLWFCDECRPKGALTEHALRL